VAFVLAGPRVVDHVVGARGDGDQSTHRRDPARRPAFLRCERRRGRVEGRGSAGVPRCTGPPGPGPLGRRCPASHQDGRPLQCTIASSKPRSASLEPAWRRPG
jgi:hypothetical protein